MVMMTMKLLQPYYQYGYRGGFHYHCRCGYEGSHSHNNQCWCRHGTKSYEATQLNCIFRLTISVQRHGDVCHNEEEPFLACVSS
jgi:hypothetical protein